MSRDEQIIKKSASYEEGLYYEKKCPFNPEWFHVKEAFAAGARWADENPKSETVDFQCIINYLDSILVYGEDGKLKCQFENFDYLIDDMHKCLVGDE